MNKAITDGITFDPLPFSAGLALWSSGDGTPGSPSYAISGSGVFVAADQDFSGCLEILKQHSTTKLRFMGETPILAGCYLQVTARVKAVAGPMPAVAIAGWAGAAGGVQASGLVQADPVVQLTKYGAVVEVKAIIATADRAGVDLPWSGAQFGHIGLDLAGPSGGLVRIDDISIEDVSSVFIRDLIGLVDVRDYGAKGDGVTDDSAAFNAADSAAGGQTVMVPEGAYLLENNVMMQSPVQFEGRIIQSPSYRFILQRD